MLPLSVDKFINLKHIFMKNYISINKFIRILKSVSTHKDLPTHYNKSLNMLKDSHSARSSTVLCTRAYCFVSL